MNRKLTETKQFIYSPIFIILKLQAPKTFFCFRFKRQYVNKNEVRVQEFKGSGVQRSEVQGSGVEKSEYPPAMHSALSWCNH